MTLHSQREFSIPEETIRVAHAAYPKGNLYMKMRDTLGDDISGSVLCPCVPPEWTPCYLYFKNRVGSRNDNLPPGKQAKQLALT